MKHIYNRKKDKVDPRDHKYLAAPLPAPLPPVCDNRHLDGPIDDQGDLGSCTAFSSGGALQYLETQELRANLPLNAAPEEHASVFVEVSKLFIYYNERAIEGTVSDDSGGELRDVVKAIAQSGACQDNLCPYVVSQFTMKPSDAAYAEAANHKITQYASLSSLNDIKHAIASGFPVVFGITVYESFESDAAAQTGNIPMPNLSGEQCLGGHAVCAVGYDDSKQCLIVRNSWGTGWGAAGYFYLPYAYVQDPNLSEDFWVIKK
jgi:C1A family cysteine protease